MRILILVALAGASVFAQPTDAAKPGPTVVKSKALTEAKYEKMLRLQVGYQQAKDLQDAKRDIALMPWASEINGLMREVCLELGVPESKISEQCKFDADKEKGKGFGEVRWEKPADTPKPEPGPANSPSPAQPPSSK